MSKQYLYAGNTNTTQGKMTGVGSSRAGDKVSNLNDLRKPLQDRDGMAIRHSVWGTDITRTDYVEQKGEDSQILSMGYTDRSGRPMAFGNDVHDYVQALEESLDDTFNDGEFAQCVQEKIFPCEFRPFGVEPTPLNIQLLEDRSVRFTPGSRAAYGSLPEESVAKAGSTLMVSPILHSEDNNTRTGILCSVQTHVSDFNMMSGWTEGSLIQTVTNMQIQYCRVMAGNVAKVLKDTPDLATIKCAALSSKPKDAAEDLLDALAMHLPVHLGSSLDQFALMIPEKLEAVLERAAQRAGHEDASELFGCTIMGYLGDDSGVYLLPKGFAMLSFRSTKEGDTVKVNVTRDPNRAGYDVELISVIDVMATGTVKVATGKFDKVAEASFPLVHRLVFGETK